MHGIPKELNSFTDNTLGKACFLARSLTKLPYVNVRVTTACPYCSYTLSPNAITIERNLLTVIAYYADAQRNRVVIGCTYRSRGLVCIFLRF